MRRYRANNRVSRRGGGAGLIRNIAGGAVSAYNAYNSYKQRRGNDGAAKQASTSAPLTTQFDSRRLYRFKRMPKRKRRAWVRFSKKVQAVTNLLGNNYLSYTSVGNQSVAAGTQAYSHSLIYGVDGVSTGFGIRDIAVVVSDLGVATTDQAKLMFKSVSLDAEWNADPSNTSSITLDIYEIIVRKDISRSTANNISDMFYLGIFELDTVPGAGGSLQANQVGVTPFQSKLFCQNIKILSKTRVRMSPGQTCHKELRDPKNRRIMYTPATSQLLAKGGWTRGFFWIAEAVTNGTDFSPAFKINYADIRTYNVQVDDPSKSGGGRN